jgi:murein DD-endopeptidase MepM/ murein hydrolase activator NlpD
MPRVESGARVDPSVPKARPIDEVPREAAVESGRAGPTISANTTVHGSDIQSLRERALTIPVSGLEADDLVSTFHDARGSRRHEAIDILAPRGTDVLAVEDGEVAKIFTSAAGGLTVYQFDPSRTFVYYYAHLDSYAPGLKEGAMLRRGDVVGTVGTTGNAPKDTPHLHFAIAKLDPDKRWWGGTALDPFLVWRDPSEN